MATVRVDVPELEKVRKEIAGMRERAANLEPVLKGRAEALRTLVVTEAFGKSQDPWGKAWQPLMASTVDRRRKRSAKPLVDTGLLRGSIVSRATEDAILIGVSGAASEYAGAHLFGTDKAGRGRTTKIEARPFLPILPGGEPSFHAGPAQKWYERARDRVTKWILEGKV